MKRTSRGVTRSCTSGSCVVGRTTAGSREIQRASGRCPRARSGASGRARPAAASAPPRPASSAGRRQHQAVDRPRPGAGRAQRLGHEARRHQPAHAVAQQHQAGGGRPAHGSITCGQVGAAGCRPGMPPRGPGAAAVAALVVSRRPARAFSAAPRLVAADVSPRPCTICTVPRARRAAASAAGAGQPSPGGHCLHRGIEAWPRAMLARMDPEAPMSDTFFTLDERDDGVSPCCS
jgi:hypothetical protein